MSGRSAISVFGFLLYKSIMDDAAELASKWRGGGGEGESGSSIWVGNATFYVAFSEFGTQRESAKPQFRPALQAVAARWGNGELQGGGKSQQGTGIGAGGLKGRSSRTFSAHVTGLDSRRAMHALADAIIEEANANTRRLLKRRTGRLEHGWAKGATVEELIADSRRRGGT